MFGSRVSDHQTDIIDIRQLAKEILKNNLKLKSRKLSIYLANRRLLKNLMKKLLSVIQRNGHLVIRKLHFR